MGKKAALKQLELREVKDVKLQILRLWETARSFSNGSRGIEEYADKIESYELDPQVGESSYFLRVLALELYLKLLFLSDREMLVHGHHQKIIFKMLNKDTRDELLAEINLKRNMDEENLCDILEKAGQDFTKVRYFFESYADISEEELDKNNRPSLSLNRKQREHLNEVFRVFEYVAQHRLAKAIFPPITK